MSPLLCFNTNILWGNFVETTLGNRENTWETREYTRKFYIYSEPQAIDAECSEFITNFADPTTVQNNSKHLPGTVTLFLSGKQ